MSIGTREALERALACLRQAEKHEERMLEALGDCSEVAPSSIGFEAWHAQWEEKFRAHVVAKIRVETELWSVSRAAADHLASEDGAKTRAA